MKLYFLFLTLYFNSLVSWSQNHGSHGANSATLRPGKYYGEMYFNSRNEKFAIQADVFLVSPHNFTEFPKLEIILKVNFGGFNSREFLVYHFVNIITNFETGEIFIDEKNIDLVLESQVHDMRGRSHIEGQVYQRSSGEIGTFNLLQESDEPPDDEEQIHQFMSQHPWASQLAGQYNGTCSDNKETTLVIQTARGLFSEEIFRSPPLFPYGITGQLGQKIDSTENIERPWSTIGSFAGGIFNPITGQLDFLGPSTTSMACKKNNNQLICKYQTQTEAVSCILMGGPRSFNLPVTKTRKFRLSPPPEHLHELPKTNQVPDRELANILKTNYRGYLHNEVYDTYEEIELVIQSRVSTENPHNPNKVFILPTVFLGRNPSKIPIRFESIAFEMQDGFTLNSEDSDAFILIKNWKVGFIQGEWYSKSNGKIGTIELVRNPLPHLPIIFKYAPIWSGDFVSKNKISGDLERWFKLVLPPHPTNFNFGLVSFIGSYQNLRTISKFEPIKRAYLDPYSQVLAWEFENGNAVGFINVQHKNENEFEVYWPPLPGSFGNSMGNLKFDYFKRAQ